jgi:hypothetical protein
VASAQHEFNEHFGFKILIFKFTMDDWTDERK